jgi:plastocyanin
MADDDGRFVAEDLFGDQVTLIADGGVFRNRSDHEEHEILFLKLKDRNSTVEDAVAAADKFGEHGLVEGGFATKELGEIKTGPDSAKTGEFNFDEPGAYVYYCFIETHCGHWRYAARC